MPRRAGPRRVGQGGADALLLPDDLAAGRVVGVQLGVPAPVHGGVQLAGRVLLAEAGPQDVGEEAGRQVAVQAAAQRPVDGPDQRRAVQRGPGEDLLAVLDAGPGEHLAVGGQLQPVVVQLGEAEQDQRVDQRQQVVDLQAQAVGQVGQVGRAAVAAQHDLGQAGQAVDGGPRQRGVADRPRRAAAGRAGGGAGAACVALGHHPVDLVDQLLEVRRPAAARPGQRVAQVGADPAGVGAQHQDPVREQHRFLDVVGHHDDGLGREALALPQLQQLAAQVLRGQHVQRAERLVHQQGGRLDHQGPGEADALAHAARQLLGVGATRSRPGRRCRWRAAPAPTARPAATPRASRPSSTFCCTVSHGSSAKVWKTMVVSRLVPGQPLAAEQHLPAGRRASARRCSAAGSTCRCRCGRAARRTRPRPRPG